MLEIDKTNFLNIERLKHNGRKYFTPSFYFRACIKVVKFVLIIAWTGGQFGENCSRSDEKS